MFRGINIQSDFVDFYDCVHNKESDILYRRFLSESKQKGLALAKLRGLGIKTIEVKQVNQFLKEDGPLVVYTNPSKHNGEGKQIMTYEDAVSAYPNYLASRYRKDSNTTIKYLQIGEVRKSIYYEDDSINKLKIGRVLDVKNLPKEFNGAIRLPIYSIDYISVNNEMVAVDFNEVEKLDSLGIELNGNEVVTEIIKGIELFNKGVPKHGQ